MEKLSDEDFRPSAKIFRCHQLSVGVGCTMIVLLIGAVVVLATWVFQMRHPIGILEKAGISQKPKNGTTMENKSSLENFVSHLRKFLCKPLDNKETENSSCRLCPQNWSLHENKCYWVSKERRTWHKGKEDCTAKLSRMLVIQSQEEVTFIQNITEGAQLLWIGLEATFPERNWTWIDGSPLDDKLFQDLGPVEANCCGRLNGNQIISEVCNTIAIWICETNALLI
ncbi:PREDICTED: killer cell lectin-like receptor subfamily B member 1B allele B [Gekko japonicus]|uniref:Killer cell lectin-like receptor subfamily B member 1B allele B n=1 Tax=Gekko japonicus TaxID=146911 RepID=A0ABM1KMI9_GEKJA|nr:PREDICTED: killer cell lectin-like receptor subfamily B member 1B allele B [Gekko japonicus]